MCRTVNYLTQDWRQTTKQYFPSVLVLVIGGMLSLFAYNATRSWEKSLDARIFEREADSHVANLQLRITSTIEVIHSIRSLYDATRKVERAEFRVFVAHELTEEYHGFQALEWIPRVAAADRVAFEEAARADGLAGFRFTERTNQGPMVAAAARAEYFPVYFVEPLAGNEAAVGFDLGSNPSRLAVLNKARDSGETVATGRITLVQETGDQYGLLVFEPIYAQGVPVDTVAQRRDALQGFALGVLRLGDIITGAIEDKHRGSVELYLFDQSAPLDEQLLFPKSSAVRNRTDVRLSGCVDRRMDVGGRDWLITECSADSARLVEGWQPWVVLISGVAITGLLMLSLLLMLRQRARTEQLADELTQVIDTANAPIFGIDLHGLVNEWNQQAESITGFSKDEVLGRDLVADFITDDYKEAVKLVLNKTLAGDETSNFEFPLFTKSGARIDVLLNSTTRRDVLGEIIGVIGIGQDITERIEVKLIQAAKMATLGEMSTGLAHELNQPLNIIRMAADNTIERIEEGDFDADYLRGKLERISAQTERAAKIIDHMRIFGRKTNEEPVPIDLRQVTRDALGLIGEQLRLGGIEVETDFPEVCQPARGHAVHVEQVVLNLLGNARDAIEANRREPGEPRKITLMVEDAGPDDKVRLIIEDSGGGIPQDIISRIFEPFFTTKEIGKGTGLGLSISYGIIIDMGGTIEAANAGDGARITISLPVTA